jgi:dTDP-glucose 4,6-dehydratase
MSRHAGAAISERKNPEVLSQREDDSGLLTAIQGDFSLDITIAAFMIVTATCIISGGETLLDVFRIGSGRHVWRAALRTVITGGAGFIGSHLCERFVAEGHEVICVDNLLTGSRRNIDHLTDSTCFRFLEHNISEPVEIDGPVENVLHFASPASPVDYLAHPIPTLKVGSLGTHNALGLAKAKNAQFLLASTSEVYGDPEIHPQREDYWGNVNPIGPRGCYDEAKRFAEAITMAYHRFHGVKTRIVRIFNTYGPRMRLNDGRVLPNFINQALHGEPITIYGKGEQTRSFCYVSDLVEGIYRLLNVDHSLPVNLGNPSEITVHQLALEIIALVEGTRSKIVYHDLPEDDPKRRRPDITKAQTLLGWNPIVDRGVGFRKTLDYFRTVV